MKPRTQPRNTFELLQAHFDQLLNPTHELVVLANMIDWPTLGAAFADSYHPDIGAPAKAIRLMVGLHYLKFFLEDLFSTKVDLVLEDAIKPRLSQAILTGALYVPGL